MTAPVTEIEAQFVAAPVAAELVVTRVRLMMLSPVSVTFSGANCSRAGIEEIKQFAGKR